MPKPLTYEELGRFNPSGADLEVCTSAISRVVSRGGEFEIEALKQSLLRAFKRPKQVIESGIVVHYELEGRPKNLAFVYLQNRSIRAIRFGEERRLNAWFKALYRRFAKTQAYLIQFTPTEFRQFGIKDFFDQGGEAGIAALARKHAPAYFDDLQQRREREKRTEAKRAFIARFKRSPAMRSTIDPRKTLRLWRRYLDVRQATAGFNRTQLNRGAAPAAKKDEKKK